MNTNLILDPLKDIVLYDDNFKKTIFSNYANYSKDSRIETVPGILNELCDEINSIDELVVIYREKGNLGNEEFNPKNHSSRDTYIEFYALNHNYHIANALITYLSSRMEGSHDNKLIFELNEKTSNGVNTEYSTHGDNLIDISYKYVLSFNDVAIYVKSGIERIKECIYYVKEFKELYIASFENLLIEPLNDVIVNDEIDKNYFLEDCDIDHGIAELCDIINSFKVFVTINSCQGALYEDERSNHCPLTYVDFYVTNHNYYIANALLTYLSSRMEGSLAASLSIMNEMDIVGEEDGEPIWEYTSELSYRYRIDLTKYSSSKTTIKEALSKTITLIKEFKKIYKL